MKIDPLIDYYKSVSSILLRGIIRNPSMSTQFPKASKSRVRLSLFLLVCLVLSAFALNRLHFFVSLTVRTQFLVSVMDCEY